jgi:hypothetical protein
VHLSANEVRASYPARAPDDAIPDVKRLARGKRCALPAAVLATAVVLVAAGCGGSSNGGTTSTASGATSTVQWASGVCTAFSTWKQSLATITAGLKTNHTSTDLTNAEVNIKNAAKGLETTLKTLGKPGTASVQQAKTELNTLETSLSQTKASVQKTLQTKPTNTAEALADVSTVSAELAKVAQDFSTFVASVQKADPKSDLSQAFKQAPACSSYVKS